ncbi:MAG: tetratricopeptide repeat protein [Holophagales bacterium]|nr:MAG: tetratricopeptide repeat protein [Holophagales bacterium]
MKLDCRRCGAVIQIPPEVAAAGGASVICPGCGARYTRRASPVAAKPPAPTSGAAAIDSGPQTAAPGPGTPGSRAIGETPERPLSWPTAGPGAMTLATPTGLERSPDSALRLPTTGGTAATAPAGPVFAPGQLVGGRYRIVRFIARGGMGEVYEAEDLELRDRLALKTIHPKSAGDATAVERFKREIHLARRVTHPNVCRIFDVGFDDLSPGGPVVFLTMELLEGETLAARLRREGRMSVETARPLVRQMAEALGAAHAAGIIHRDFKSENVFLVPAPERGDGAPRVVVTDFGVARGARDEEAFAATMTSGVVVGTPAYMAPEQLEGGAITPAVDLYALGVVIFEMLTGELPFQGETAIATAVKRLTEPAPSPRERVADLEARWESLVLRCLARRPEDRFAAASDLVDTLSSEEGELSPPPRVTPPPVTAPPTLSARDRRMRWIAIAVGIALVVAVGSALWRIRNLRHGDLPDPGATARRAVAVLGSRNLSGEGEAAWLSTALSEMLTTEIAGGGALRTISGDQVARARRELKLAEAVELEPAELSRLRGRLGVDVLISGAYTIVPGSDGLRLDLRLRDAATGRQLASLAESGSSAQLFDLVSRIGGRAREALGAGELSKAEGEALEAALPANPEAVRLYVEGLDRLRAFEPQEARERFEQAVALDPSFALARSSLATAWSALGYEQRAQREAERAHELAARLPRDERLLVEARYREMQHDFRRAAEIYGALWQAYPDGLDYGLRLAAMQTAGGAGEQALATLGALRRLPAPLGADPRIDLAAAAAAGSLSDFKTQLASAARAAEGATAQGAKRLVAEARVSEAWAARNLGDPARARQACEEAGRIFGDVGDRSGAAAALTALAGVRYDQGDLEGARADNERALATFREVGDQSGVARALNNIAVIGRASGDRATARRLYEEVVAISLETGDRAGTAYASHNLGTLLSEEGDLAGARQRLEQALAARREIGDQAGTGASLASLGAVLRREGQLAEAQRRLEESLALQREIGQKIGQVGSLSALAQVAIDQGELGRAAEGFAAALTMAREIGNKSAEAQALAGQGELAALAARFDEAEAHHRAALALRQEIGERVASLQSRLALARVALDRGAFDVAESAGRELLAGLDDEPLPELRVQTRTVLCRAAAGRGATAAARSLGEEAVGLAASTQSPAVQLGARIAAARAGGGNRERDRAALTTALAEARQIGLASLELEARFALAELGPRDDPAISTLARDARARGYLTIAAQAERLATR